MNVVVRGSNQSHAFAVPAGEPILYSALRHGIDLPHECISGTCGSCKATLRTGTVEKLWQEAPGWALTKPGEYLLCQCAAAGDCEFEVKQAIGAALPTVPALREGTLRDWQMLTGDVVAFSVELDSEVEFQAGQFAALQVPGIQGARCYSMVNSASPTRRLDFVIKRKPGGAVSHWLLGADRSGEPVQCFGPVGKAVFDPDLPHDIVCIAGGSGIAGMLSIVARAGECGHLERHRAHVFFGVRGPSDVFFLQQLEDLHRNYPSVRITVALSDEAPPEELRAAYPGIGFDSGMVHEVAGRKLTAPLGPTSAFVAGPPPAVTAALRVLLLQMKIPGPCIKYDKFA